MANWYDASFRTTDKDIIDVIKNGRTIDFYYDEKLEVGSCRLAWGLCSIDIEKIDEIATEHKSSFYIRTSDYLTSTIQEWEFKDGVEILAETRHDEVWRVTEEEPETDIAEEDTDEDP